MIRQSTIDKLHDMRLSAMSDAFEYQCAYSAKSAHPFRRNGAPFRLKLSNAQLVN